MKKVTWFLILFMFLGLASSYAMAPKPSASSFKDPVVSLELFEVPQYDGFWYYSNKVEPTKGKADNRGAPLPMSFLFAIENPNPYPVTLEGLKFTVNVDGFDLVTVNNDDMYIIPAESTDHVRVTTMITARSALLSLMVTGGFKLQEQGMSPWEALEKWWTGLAGYTQPVSLKGGTAEVSAGDVSKVLAFELTSS
nr:LEA type 2 family protein [Desulfatibacillum aliphaticivorans]